jgi:hypothetical protein
VNCRVHPLAISLAEYRSKDVMYRQMSRDLADDLGTLGAKTHLSLGFKSTADSNTYTQNVLTRLNGTVENSVADPDDPRVKAFILAWDRVINNVTNPF